MYCPLFVGEQAIATGRFPDIPKPSACAVHAVRARAVRACRFCQGVALGCIRLPEPDAHAVLPLPRPPPSCPCAPTLDPRLLLALASFADAAGLISKPVELSSSRTLRTPCPCNPALCLGPLCVLMFSF